MDLQVTDAECAEQLPPDGRVVRVAWSQAEAEDLLEAGGNSIAAVHVGHQARQPMYRKMLTVPP